jgi:hypothetical protein
LDGVRRLPFSLDRHPFHRWFAARSGLAAERCEQTLSPEFRGLMHAFVREVIAPCLDYVPFVQKGAYVRIHRGGGTTFHSDAALGHAADEENVWIALTPAKLHVLSLADSQRLSIDDTFQARALALATPLLVSPGEALLFTSRHVHGVPSPAEQTSIDFRLAPRINPHAILGCPFEALAAG